jgi:hypothetical protein
VQVRATSREFVVSSAPQQLPVLVERASGQVLLHVLRPYYRHTIASSTIVMPRAPHPHAIRIPFARHRRSSVPSACR